MPIAMRCPECNVRFRVPDKAAGKNVRCPKCGDVISVPRKTVSDRDVDTASPTRRRSPRRQAGSMLPWILVGGVAFLLLGGIGVWVMFVASNTDDPPKKHVADNRDKTKDSRVPKNDSVVPNPSKDRNIQKDKPTPRRDIGKDGNKPTPMPMPAAQTEPYEAVSWQMNPDPGPDISTNPANVDQPIPTPEVGMQTLFMFYCTTPSPFAVARAGLGSKANWMLVDMLKCESKPTGVDVPAQSIRVSPDGKHLMLLDGDRLTLRVFSTADGKELPKMKSPGWVYMDYDFGPSGHLLGIRRKKDSPGWFYDVWRFTDGKHLREGTLFNATSESLPYGFSPGRRYFAELGQGAIRVLEIVSGTTVGEIPTIPKNDSIQQLFFSPDGTLFTLAVGGNRLVTYDVAAGKKLEDVTLPDNYKKLSRDPSAGGRSTWDNEPTWQWLPDNTGWVAKGGLVIDRLSANVLYLPDGSLDYHYKPVVGGYYLATYDSNGGIHFLPLPKDKIETVRKEARESRSIVEAFPDAPRGDHSEAKELAKPVEGSVPWQVKSTPFPRPTVVKSDPLELVGTYKSKDIVKVMCARDKPDSIFVACVHGPNKALRIDQYDRATRKHIEGVSLCPWSLVRDDSRGRLPVEIDISPDGTRALVRSGQEPLSQCVELFSLTERKLLCSWIPQPGDWKVVVQDVRFVANDLVLTSTGGRLVLWRVPECKAVYSIEGYGPAVVSATGQYLASSNGTTLDVLESATGELRGRLKFPEDSIGPIKAGVFDSDTTRLMVTFTNGKRFMGERSYTAWWDVTTGKFGGQRAYSPSRRYHWLDENLYIGDLFVYSWHKITPAWSFQLGSYQPDVAPVIGGRMWILRPTADQPKKWQLFPINLTESNLKAVGNLFASGDYTLKQIDSRPAPHYLIESKGKTYKLLRFGRWSVEDLEP